MPGAQRIPFHADLSVPAGTAAGMFPVYDPQAAELLVTHIRVSTDTKQRVVIGTDDSDGQRMAAGYLPAGGAGILADVAIDTGATSMVGKVVQLFTSAASGVEVGIEGCILLPATP